MEHIHIDTLPESHNKKGMIKSWLQHTSDFLCFEYQSDFGNTKHLRDFIEVICQELSMKETQTSRIILICDELNNNAIEYGSAPGNKNIMRICTLQEGGEQLLQIEVEDTGDGSSPKTALDMETMRAHKLKLGYGKHDSIRGRGLFLITVQIAERLYFKNAKDKQGLIVGVKVKQKETD